MGTKIRARIVGDEAELGQFSTLIFFGIPLSRDFSEVEVEDGPLAKLKGNRYVEVQVKRSTSAETKTPASPADAAA